MSTNDLDFVSMSILASTQPEIAKEWCHDKGWLPGMSWGEYLFRSQDPDRPMRRLVLVDVPDCLRPMIDTLHVRTHGYREEIRDVDGYAIRYTCPIWTLAPEPSAMDLEVLSPRPAANDRPGEDG